MESAPVTVAVAIGRTEAELAFGLLHSRPAGGATYIAGGVGGQEPRLRWRLDADLTGEPGFQVVQRRQTEGSTAPITS
ncbi:hypothetical protein [Micromonospora sp. NPDC000668]|uniref:hypothetical protein n=1 Tax=Micromonospora sp. NPDC000668 TaxID=3364219 RepID=UPI0036AA1EFE